MPFQKQVNLYNAAGTPGDAATENPVVYTTYTPFADGDVSVARFVWASGDKGGAKNTGSGKPLGFLRRVLAYPNYKVSDVGTLVVPEGSPLTVAKKGDFFAVATTAATVGQKVFAVLADGTVKTDAAGATVAGAIETDYRTETAGAAGELIVISAW